MKWRRTTLAVCAFVAAGLFAAFVISQSRPIRLSAVGRATMDDGSPGYFFSITNRSNRPLKVRLSRNEAPPVVSGVAIIVHTTIAPKSQWRAALWPPDEPAPWSATLEYFPEPGPLTRKLQSIGAYFRLRPKDPQWTTVQTIQIKEGGK